MIITYIYTCIIKEKTEDDRRIIVDKSPIPEKVTLDVEYMERQSFSFDMYILWLTVQKVVKRGGVYH